MRYLLRSHEERAAQAQYDMDEAMLRALFDGPPSFPATIVHRRGARYTLHGWVSIKGTGAPGTPHRMLEYTQHHADALRGTRGGTTWVAHAHELAESFTVCPES